MRVITTKGIGRAEESGNNNYYVWLNNTTTGIEMKKEDVFPLSSWGILRVIEIREEKFVNFSFFKNMIDAERFFDISFSTNEIVVYCDFEKGVFIEKSGTLGISKSASWISVRLDCWEKYHKIEFSKIYGGLIAVNAIKDNFSDIEGVRLSLLLSLEEGGKILDATLFTSLGVIVTKKFPFEQISVY